MNVQPKEGIEENVMNEKQNLKRIMETYPQDSFVIPGSTPVVSFGDPSKASVVTIGINPSSREFGNSSRLFKPGMKRLEDFESLGITDPSQISIGNARIIMNGCFNYFDEDRNPYMTWFKHLNNYVNSYFGADFRKKTACHLDLVQWATDPVWSNIKDSSIRERLLSSDAGFLHEQVNTKVFKVVFLNGRQVFEQATSTKVLEADIVRTITYKTKGELERPIDFYKGQTAAGSPVLGWSRTFPGHYISVNALVGVVEELHKFFRESI